MRRLMLGLMAPVLLLLVACVTDGRNNPAEAAGQLVTGTWHGKSPNSGKWYSGSFKLVVNSTSATMYFNGSGSACKGEAIRLSVSGTSTMRMRGSGCDNASFNFTIVRGARSVSLGSKYSGRAERLVWH